MKKEDIYGMTPFLQVVAKEYYPEQHKVFYYLLKHLMANDKAYAQHLPTTLDHQKTQALETALHLAASRGDAVMVEALTRVISVIDAKDFNGNTALHRAIQLYQTLVQSCVRLERVETSLPEELLTSLIDTERCIKSLFNAGASIYLKNCNGEKPLTMVKTIPHVYQLFMRTKQSTDMNETDSNKAIVERFLRLDDTFESVYERVIAQPAPGFQAMDYQRLFERYVQIYLCIQCDVPLKSLQENSLLADIRRAQQEMMKGYVDSGRPDDVIKYHAEFFNQIFQRAYDYRIIQGNLNAFRQCYKQIERQQGRSTETSTETSTSAEHTSGSDDKTLTTQLFKTCQHLQQQLLSPACQLLRTDYAEDLDTLEGYLAHDIPLLEYADMLPPELADRPVYYESMRTWLAEQRQQSPHQAPTSTQTQAQQLAQSLEQTLHLGEGTPPKDERNKDDVMPDVVPPVQQPAFFHHTEQPKPRIISELLQLLKNATITPKEREKVSIMFYDLNLAKAFQTELEKTGFHDSSSSHVSNHKKIEPIFADETEPMDKFKITVTADEYNALTHENAYEELIEIQAQYKEPSHA